MVALTATSGGNGVPETPFGHTGGLNDRTTGWILNTARYYNPAEGRYPHLASIHRWAG